ncbi:MAG: hypothetical protein WBQ94_12855 [Terracidiphilus sp.]
MMGWAGLGGFTDPPLFLNKNEIAGDMQFPSGTTSVNVHAEKTVHVY